MRPGHTVFLYRAVAPSDVVGNVLIDNRVDEEASELLKHAYWPEWLTKTPFLSACTLCDPSAANYFIEHQSRKASFSLTTMSMRREPVRVAAVGGWLAG